MTVPARDHRRAGDDVDDARKNPSIRHYQASEYLSNERTHLAYIRTALSLISLGITVNRFSIYLAEHGGLDVSQRPLRILRDTKQIGFGMVIYGFAVMAFAMHRYLKVDRAIERLDYQPTRALVETFTLSALFLGALSLIWMFLR
ncbi:MAG TPA: DUF202 domain-containing protein [Gemmatimonadaceae bacterium]|jgi:putative membrane protein